VGGQPIVMQEGDWHRNLSPYSKPYFFNVDEYHRELVNIGRSGYEVFLLDNWLLFCSFFVLFATTPGDAGLGRTQ